MYLGNPHLPPLKCSTRIGHRFCSEFLQTGGVGHSTLEQHHVGAARIHHEAKLSFLESHSNGHNRRISLERGGEAQALYPAEEHFLGSVVDSKTAFPEDIQAHNPIHLVANGFLQEREVFGKNRKRLCTNRAKK